MKTVHALLLLVPLAASAEWRQLPAVFPGVIRDVQMVDAGVVLAVSTVEATTYLATDAGVSTLVSMAGNFVGAGYYGPNCLIGLQVTGSVVGSSGCPGGPSFGSVTPVRFRLLRPTPFAVAVFTSGSSDQLVAGPQTDGGWGTQGGTWSGAGDRALQTSQIDGIDYAAMNSSSFLARVSVDGGAPFNVSFPNPLRDVAPFARLGAPALLGVGNVSGVLYVVPDLRAPSVLTPAIPTGASVRYASIEQGVAMATSLSGAILSPLPDPARPALTWVARAGAPVLTERIDCIQEGWCASITSGGAVWVYENVAAPTVVVAPITVDAGQLLRLVASASDSDGDPTFSSWSGVAGLSLVPVAGIDDGSQIDLLVPSGAACGLTSLNVTVRDGLPSHDRVVQVPVTLIDRGAASIAVSSRLPIAGGPPVSFVASVDGGCDTPAFTWTSSDGQSGGGAQFTWQPPVVECTSGQMFNVTATATWPSGAPATSQQVEVLTLQPWGAPFAPVFPTPANQASGTSVVWAPLGASHVCEGDGGFPGTQLLWEPIDAGLVRATPVDGGLLVVAPPTCVALQVAARVRREVVGEAFGRSSDAGTLVVDITPDTAPLGPTTPFGSSFAGDAGLIFGDTTVTASCLSQRALVSQISVFSGPVLLASQPFNAPGPWAVVVPGGCAGGTFGVVAALIEDGGLTGASASGTVTLPSTPARVGALSGSRIDVVCGVGARAALSLLPAPGACGTAEISWLATGGPALTASSGAGTDLVVQTMGTDFSGVGQRVVFVFAADAGLGNVDSAERVVELGVQPFLEVTVASRPALRREEEPLTLVVSLHNPTACTVSGLTLRLPVEGASAVLESARLDGAPVTASTGSGSVRLEGLSVNAGQTATVTLDVRPRLLGSPTVLAVAELAGYPVSTVAPAGPAPSGCGCGVGPTSAWLGLWLFTLVRRRRRAGLWFER